jgi:AMMECR1 domain-containing protein
MYEPTASASEVLNQERGAFVTLRKSGELRGCIGYTSAAKPLYMDVRDTATLAALRDPDSSRCRPQSCRKSIMRSPCCRPFGACWIFDRSRLASTVC